MVQRVEGEALLPWASESRLGCSRASGSDKAGKTGEQRRPLATVEGDPRVQQLKEFDSVTGQNDIIFDIYCITGESIATSSSPFLYMVDPTDESEMQRLKEFDDQKLKSTTNADEDEKGKVLISSRTADSPCALTTSGYGWSANIERTMKAQGLIWLLFDTLLLALSDGSMNSYLYSLGLHSAWLGLHSQPDGAEADDATVAQSFRAFPGCSQAGLSGLSPQRWTRCA